MTLAFSVAHHDGYSSVRVDGEPDVNEFIAFIQQMGKQSTGWPSRAVLVDLRSIPSLTTFTEHYAIGEAVARELGHLRKVASVVPADRVTHASEKTARRAGVNLTVFTDEGEAVAWLASPDR